MTVEQIKETARQFNDQSPRATDEEIKRHASENFADAEERRLFSLAMWSLTLDRRAKQAKFTADVSRIWPEEKGY